LVAFRGRRRTFLSADVGTRSNAAASSAGRIGLLM